MARFEDDGEMMPETKSLKDEIVRLSDELTEAISDLRMHSRDWAKKDNEMRKARAKAFLQATGKNKEEREARADASYEKERLAANLAEAEKNVAQEHVRSLRAQISALQSLVYANRAESESIRYGQTQTT